MHHILFYLMIAIITTSCATDDEPFRYQYGACYQPLYWPSDCVEPEWPSREEMAAIRKREFERRRERQGN